MKLAILFMATAVMLTVVWQAVSHSSDPPIRQFSVKQLSAQQVAACYAFKSGASRPRHSQFERVQALGILPLAPLIREANVLHAAKAA